MDAVSENRSVFELTASPSLELIQYGDHEDQLVEVFKPDAISKGRILLIHGGYWRPEYDRVHLRPYAVRLAQEGYETFLFEYRRTPGSPDTYLEDLTVALEVVGECALVGHSAGGHLALLLSSHPNTQRIVALAPVSDLVMGEEFNLDDGAVALFLGGPAASRPDLDPMTLDFGEDRITVIHGDRDQRVPVEMSQKFAKRFAAMNYTELADIGHFELIDPRLESIVELVMNGVARS